MRAIIFLSLVALSLTAHSFRAETNFKCQLCKEIVGLVKQDKASDGNVLIEQFPKQMQSVVEMIWKKLSKDIPDNLDAVRDCQAIKFCQELRLRISSPTIPLKEIAQEVNKNDWGWKADENSKFLGITHEDAQSMLGTIVDPAMVVKMPTFAQADEVMAPASFDARTQWPNCKSISTIRDQANCGSCWAFGTTEAFNDRACIADYSGNGPSLPLFSTADTVGCCGFLQCFSQGCNGGQIGTPWKWFGKTGVVTGGMMGDKSTCQPYTMPECAHHVASQTLKDCSTIKQVQPKCSKKCQDGYATEQKSDKQKSSDKGYSLGSVDDVKKDIATYGSVTGAFTVYEDFLTYKSGVYSHKTGKALGGHAIKLVGQGTESGQDYFIVNNSWNNTWGDNGTFKIVTDEIGQFAAGNIAK